jgi:hypothetical protein
MGPTRNVVLGLLDDVVSPLFHDPEAIVNPAHIDNSTYYDNTWKSGTIFISNNNY